MSDQNLYFLQTSLINVKDSDSLCLHVSAHVNTETTFEEDLDLDLSKVCTWCGSTAAKFRSTATAVRYRALTLSGEPASKMTSRF